MLSELTGYDSSTGVPRKQYDRYAVPVAGAAVVVVVVVGATVVVVVVVVVGATVVVVVVGLFAGFAVNVDEPVELVYPSLDAVI